MKTRGLTKFYVIRLLSEDYDDGCPIKTELERCGDSMVEPSGLGVHANCRII